MRRWIAKSYRFEGLDIDKLIESQRARASKRKKEKARAARASYLKGTKKVKVAAGEARKRVFVQKWLQKKASPSSSSPSGAALPRSSMRSVTAMKAMKAAKTD